MKRGVLLTLGVALGAAPPPPPGALVCSGCHAATADPGFPPIAGRAAAELEAELLAYRAGTRPATVMDRLTRGFSPDELTSIAAYWAAQK